MPSLSSTIESIPIFFFNASSVMKPKNILLIPSPKNRDVVLTTPMLVALKELFPATPLTLLVNSTAAQLLWQHPANITEILSLPKPRKKLFLTDLVSVSTEIRTRNFDLLLVPFCSWLVDLLALFSGIPLRIGCGQTWLSRFSYHRSLALPEGKQAVDRLLQFFREGMNVKKIKSSRQPSLAVHAETLTEIRSMLSMANAGSPILIVPSCSEAIRNWSTWNFAVLIGKMVRKYKQKIFIVGELKDMQTCNKVMYFIKMFQPIWVQEYIHNICSKTSLPSLYALITQSSLLIANDSLPVHLAAAANIPTVAIFGSTIPQSGYAPLATKSIVVQKRLGCRPCSYHGHRHPKQCPQKHFRCLKEITPTEVLESVEKVLE